MKVADPQIAIGERLKLRNNLLKVNSVSINLAKYDRVFVIGGGKASMSMAAAVEKLLGERITDGLINYPNYLKPSKLSKIRLNAASHPIPNREGVSGVERMLRIGGEAKDDDLFICLISGGGSSLMPLPLEGITLGDKQRVTSSLLRCGADIHEVNIVRKHISGVKGGRLAEKLFPATILTLIISDVVGDDMSSIASGPTVPDPSTNGQAIEILKRRKVWHELPSRVRKVLQDKSKNSETPKANSRVFKRVHNILIGSNERSCLAARKEMEKMGYRSTILSTRLRGDARQAGMLFSSIISEIKTSGRPLEPPAAVIAGGETTVAVKGRGLGGRNQEFALAASTGIKGLRGVAIASIGTDGVDGYTEAAGAVVDGWTVQRGERRGLDVNHYLDNNDSYHYLKATRDLIITGPTGTNVNDIMIGASL